MKKGSRQAVNNRANQLNPNNAAYRKSRGAPATPPTGQAVPAKQPTPPPEKPSTGAKADK